MHCDLIVVGGGPAGMAAALGAVKAGLGKVLVLDRNERAGGVLPQCVHDGFGLYLEGKSLTGPEYARLWRQRLKNCPGVQLRTQATVLSVEGESPFVVHCLSPQGSDTFTADAVVFATGCRERPLGALRIPGSRPSGIYTAGTAQYMMNVQNLLPGKSVVILGSGDIGLIMARRLTLEGAKVKLILGLVADGLVRNHVQCVQDFGIPIRFGYTVLSTHGFGRLKGVTVAPLGADGRPVVAQKQYVPCDTLLLAAGLIPETELYKPLGQPLAANGGIGIDEVGSTGVPGLYACGNVTRIYDLVDQVSCAGERAGCAAAAWVLAGRGKAAAAEYAPAVIQVTEPRGLAQPLAADELACTLCPSGCRMRAPEDAHCPKGAQHFQRERQAPLRTLTTTVKITGCPERLLPVRTDAPIVKALLAAALCSARKVTAHLPVTAGTVLMQNIVGSGANLIACDDLPERE